MRHPRLLKTLLLALSLGLPPLHAADKPDDQVALKGLKTARVVWDVTTADPLRLASHLALIEQTWSDQRRQGVRPEMVLAFREGAVRLISRQAELLPFEQSADAEQARERLAHLAASPGVRVEVCAIAMRAHGVRAETLPAWAHPVGNSFNSIIGRAPKGFAVITLP